MLNSPNKSSQNSTFILEQLEANSEIPQNSVFYKSWIPESQSQGNQAHSTQQYSPFKTSEEKYIKQF